MFGKPYNLPHVACAHNSYYLWSKERVNGNILLQIDNDDSFEDSSRLFEEVKDYPGIYKSSYVSPHKNNLVVFIFRYPKMPLKKWNKARISLAVYSTLK